MPVRRRAPRRRPALTDAIDVLQPPGPAVPNGRGGWQPAAAVPVRIPANISPETGREEVIADQERGVQRYAITVRNIGAGAAIETGHRIRYRGVDLEIVTAPVAAPRELYRTVTAEAGVETPPVAT